MGYMITHQGIEINPNHMNAIHNLHPPQNPKEVQRLTRMVAALNYFISQSADRCRPFFQLLHKWKDFAWTKECDRAFKELKKYLTHSPFLSRPKKEEILYAYIEITADVVSLVLIRMDEEV